MLLEKLQLIKTQIISKIFEILDGESQVRVSLLVYTNFSKLAKADVLTEYRSLEILRVKSNFNPTRNWLMVAITISTSIIFHII